MHSHPNFIPHSLPTLLRTTSPYKPPLCAHPSDTPRRPILALTREPHKNHPLATKIHLAYPTLRILSLPCIQTIPNPHITTIHLPDLLKDTTRWSWILLTSPEGAKVYNEAWKIAGRPKGRVGVVGDATRRVVVKGGGSVEWMPRVAKGVNVGMEVDVGDGGEVLYVTSGRAGGELEEVLGGRGVEVVRVNGYDTGFVEWDNDERDRAGLVGVVTWASPSAVDGWIKNFGEEVNWDLPAACIGSTSGIAARERGFRNVFWPENPGVEGWVESIGSAVECYHGIQNRLHASPLET